jgi:hypothetical protein
MHIDFPASELIGTLSRTSEAALTLSVGRILEGTIISATRTTAVFETGGVRIPARTELPLPIGAEVRLLVTSITPDRIVLRLVPTEALAADAALTESDLQTVLRQMGLDAAPQEMAAGRALLRFGLPLDAAGVRSATRPAGVPLNNAPAARAFARYLGLPESDGILRALDQVLSSGPKIGDQAAEVQSGALREKGLVVDVGRGDLSRSLERAVRGIAQSTENSLAAGRPPDDVRTALLARSGGDASPEAALARHLMGQQIINSVHSRARGADACVYFQIPILAQGSAQTLELRIERDGPGGDIDPDHLTFALRLGTEHLGEVEVSGVVVDDAVTCRFVCDGDRPCDALSSEVQSLADGLRRSDLTLSHAAFEPHREGAPRRDPLCTPACGSMSRVDTHG